MQRLSPMFVAASVVLAIAGNAALAQTKAARTPTNPNPSQIGGGATINQAPRNGATFPADRGPALAGTGGDPAFTPSKPTDVDVRNQQNQQATQDTFSSGSNSNSAAANAGGTTTAGSSSVNGSGGRAIISDTLVPTNTTNPLVIDGGMGGAVAGSDVVSDNVAIDNIETARAEASIDRAIDQGARDRKKIGRNGQLLQSIAPRTTVDRTGQMPNDPPSPALK